MSHQIKPKDAEDFAKTKHEGLPERKQHETFEQWLKRKDPELYEVATTTADVALFARPLTVEPVRRNKKQK